MAARTPPGRDPTLPEARSDVARDRAGHRPANAFVPWGALPGTTLPCTGYEPFGDHEFNPSGAVARALDGARVAEHAVVGRVLPVEFRVAGERVRELIVEHDPAVVVATGLAAGRTAVSVERVAVNVADAAGTPDNAGADPVDEPVDPRSEDAYLATIPVRETAAACLAAGVPARVSNTAGTHLCNDVPYETLSYLDRTDQALPVGFLHLPATPAQVARRAREAGDAVRGGGVTASLPLEASERAVLIALETAV